MSTVKNVFLMGGVGNQLFQIARACSHRENGCEVSILRLSRNEKHIYRLIGFTHHEDWIDIDRVLNKLDINTKEVSYSQMLTLMFLFILRKLGVNRYFDTKIDEAPNSYTKFIDVGYYQSEKHLTSNSVKEVGNALIDLLGISSDKDNSGIVLHIRGDDFFEADRLKGYDIERVKDLARRRKLKIHIVTNDKKFALEVCGSSENIFVNDSSSARDDFIFLGRSNVLFLSNSTFAFWAATVASISNSAEVFASNNSSWKNLINLVDINCCT